MYEVTFRNANLTDAIMNVGENLSIIDCGKNWRYADVEKMNAMISGGSYRLFENILNELEKNFDYILIDTEPKKSVVVFRILSAIDEVIIPFTLTKFSVLGAMDMVDYIKNIKDKYNPNLKIKAFVPMIVAPRSKTEGGFLENFNQINFSIPNIRLANTKIPRSTSGENSLTIKGAPVTLVSKNKLAKAYEALVEELEDL